MIYRGKRLAVVSMLAACTSLYGQSPISGPLNLNQRNVAAGRLSADLGATFASGARRITSSRRNSRRLPLAIRWRISRSYKWKRRSSTGLEQSRTTFRRSARRS
jgi:hypothetical protein